MSRVKNDRLLAIGESVRMTRLRVLLMGIGKPQYVIAAELGFSPTRLSEYAHGAKIPPHHLILICQYFRKNPEDIIGWTDV